MIKKIITIFFIALIISTQSKAALPKPMHCCSAGVFLVAIILFNHLEPDSSTAMKASVYLTLAASALTLPYGLNLFGEVNKKIFMRTTLLLAAFECILARLIVSPQQQKPTTHPHKDVWLETLST